MKITDLTLLENNPRQISSEELAKLKESIKNFKKGLEVIKIKVDENNTVIGGNQRVKALKELGYEEIPDEWIQKVEGLTQEEKDRIILLDNSPENISGSWDEEILKDWDKDLLGDLGFDLMEEIEAVEDDYTPPEEIKTDIKEGDLFEIKKDGKVLHKLLCGDATKKEDVERLIGDEKATLAHNDPPYGMKKESEGVTGDNMNYDDLLAFNAIWINYQWEVLKDNGSWYCWGIDEPLMDIYSNILKPLIKNQKATFRNLITWDKLSSPGQTSEDMRSYKSADEKCLFVMCGVQGFNNNADNYFEGWESIRKYLYDEYKKSGFTRKELNDALGSSEKSCGGIISHYIDKAQFSFPPEDQYKKLRTYCEQNNIDAFKRPYTSLDGDYKGLKEEYEATRAYFDNTHDNMNNVWHFERSKGEERQGNHATPKPIELCNRVIKTSSQENDLVIDFFGGSGSTMIACHQLNRRCNMMELEPKYCQVILDRIKKLDNTLEITNV